MSRFETSKFVRDKKLMNQGVLENACKELGWQYSIKDKVLFVYDLGIGKSFQGEYAIRVENNIVSYNTYYHGNTGSEVRKLQDKFNELNVAYTQDLLIAEFKKMGFTYKSNMNFHQTEEEKVSFYMVGRTKKQNETEPIGEIKFTILFDGTIISDSNYLPDDVNEKAHLAMDSIDEFFGTKRIMTKKEIPLKYKGRITHSKNIQKIKRNDS